jgi:hypothetical protein
MVQRRQLPWSERTEMVQSWRASGLSALQFAAQNGINPRSLEYWASSLASKRNQAAVTRRGDTHELTAAPSDSVTSQSSLSLQLDSQQDTSPLSFIEVAAPCDSRFEIEWRSDWRLRVPQSFDADALSSLLGVLGCQP